MKELKTFTNIIFSRADFATMFVEVEATDIESAKLHWENSIREEIRDMHCAEEDADWSKKDEDESFAAGEYYLIVTIQGSQSDGTFVYGDL